MKKRCFRLLAGFLAMVIVFTSSYFPLKAEGTEGAILQVSDDSAGRDVYSGETVTLFAQVINGEASCYEYCFSLLASENEVGKGEGTTLKGFSSESSYVFCAEEAGDYVFEIVARNTEGQMITKTHTLRVLEKQDAFAEESVPEEDQNPDENTTEKIISEENSALVGEEEKSESEDVPFGETKIPNVSAKNEIALCGTLTSNSGYNIKQNEEVVLTADASGGTGEINYRFTETYNGTVKTVQAYSKDNTYTFRANGEGTHIFTLAIKDGEGNVANAECSITVEIPSDKKLSGRLSSSTGTTADIREQVTLTADHSGGYGKVEYRFTEVYNGETKTVQAYSEKAEYTFAATGPGVHTYHLAIRDEEGQAISTKYSVTVSIPSNKKLSGRLSSSTGTTADIREQVTLTADHSGGYGKVEYRFTEVYNGETKTVQAYSEKAEYTFAATGPGVHTYHLAIRDEEGQAISTTYVVNVTVPLSYKLTAQLTSLQGAEIYIRDEVTLRAVHSGGYGEVKYRFTEVYNGEATTVRPYETEDTYTFKATGPGIHTYYLAVFDEEGQAVSTTFTLLVQVATEYKLSGAIESNKTNREYVDRMITLTGIHEGGYGKVEYRFTEVYNGQATTVQPYSTQNTYTFRTTKPGKHIYNLAIRDEEGQAISVQYVMEVVVHPDYKLSGTFVKNVTGEIKENQQIVLTAQAIKGYGEPYLYRFTEEYNGRATTVQPYSEKNTYEFVIRGQGSHKYTVAIMDCEGQAISLTQTITIGKNGWYYEGGYKFYYKNNVKQLDLDGILPKQSSYEIWVNRQCCTVTVYAKDGSNGYIIPVKRFACSVGLPSTPTPKGTFYTSNKYRWHTLMGPSYGQYCTRIVNGILFHSVAGRNMTSYNLKASDYNKLGSPASHGCVRLCVRDAKWIYDNCNSGTKVVIYDSSSPGPLGKPATIKIPAGQTWDPTDPNV